MKLDPTKLSPTTLDNVRLVLRSNGAHATADMIEAECGTRTRARADIGLEMAEAVLDGYYDRAARLAREYREAEE